MTVKKDKRIEELERKVVNADLLMFGKGDWDGYEDAYYLLPEGFLGIEETTGGISGGSCWDSSDPQPYHEDYYLDVDKLLLGLHTLGLIDLDVMTIRQLMEFKKKNILNFSRSESEYYGNRTDYSALAVAYKLNKDGEIELI
jgi:hypothetical protein